MPRFEITAPDGSRWEITAPEGATEQDAIRYAQQQAQSQPREAQPDRGAASFAQPAVEPPTTTGLGAAVSGVGQSLFGLGDELAAGAGALYDVATGQGDIGESYSQRLKEQRDYMERAAEENPGAYYTGLIGGSLATPLGVGGLAAKAAPRAVAKLGDWAGRGLRQRSALAAGEGAAYGAGTGFGASEGGLQSRLEGAVGGGLTGGAIGSAVPGVTGAIGAGARELGRSVRGIVNPEAAATARVAEELAQAARGPRTSAAARDPGIDDIADDLKARGVIGDDMLRADVNTGTQELARTAANVSPEAASRLSGIVGPRSEEQVSRVSDALRKITGVTTSGTVAREALSDQASAINATNYKPIFQRTRGRAITTPSIQRFMNEDVFQDAMRVAEKRAGSRAAVEGLPRPSGTQDLQFWDQVKKALDNTASTAYRQGDNDLGGITSSMAKQMRGELDKLVPAYGKARSQAASFFNADNALEAGENFGRNLMRYGPDQADAALKKMKPNERKLFEQGFVSELQNMISRAKDNRDISRMLAGSSDHRRRLQIALGGQKAREIEALMHVENIMQQTKNAITGNSTTVKQALQAAAVPGAQLGAGGLTGYAYGGDLQSAAAGAALGSAGRWAGRSVVGRQQQKWANQVAELLSRSDNPEALQRALRRMSVDNKFMNFLRNWIKSSGVVGQVGGAVGAQEAPQ